MEIGSERDIMKRVYARIWERRVTGEQEQERREGITGEEARG